MPAPGGSPWCPHDRLVGRTDMLTLQELRAGDSIQLCQKCCSPYTLESYAFIRRENHGQCATCRRTDQFVPLTLTVGVTAPTKPAVIKQSVIGLADIPMYVDAVVDFEAQVVRVHESKNGTFFVRFDHDRNPISGFKLVIYKNYAEAWRARGLSPTSYAGKRIRVHGLVKNHEDFGMEIIIYSPDAITVLDGPQATRGSEIRWRR
jgi:hypothetical protein